MHNHAMYVCTYVCMYVRTFVLCMNVCMLILVVTSGCCRPSAADEEWYSPKGLPAQWQSNIVIVHRGK